MKPMPVSAHGLTGPNDLAFARLLKKLRNGRTRRAPTGPIGTNANVIRFIAPHNLFFVLYTALYFIPLWIVGTSGYGEGVLLETGTDARVVMNRIVGVYLVGTLSFLVGSWSTSKVVWLLGGTVRRKPLIAKINIYHIDKILVVGLILAFLASKVLLVPAGVYSSYAFDNSMMETPVWTSSMFLSETLAFASLIALFSKLRHNVLVFTVLSMVNGVNLLHGTRNFFVTAMTGAMLYAYIRKGVSLVKMAIYGLAGFLVAVFLAYIVYLYRAHEAFTDFSLISVLSPITYESVFSQMSLVTLLGQPWRISVFGHPHRLIQDIVVFTLPRLIIGHKETLLWASQFSDLSPLGAANGFSTGLLYFGYCLPVGYFLLGLMAGMIQRFANKSYGAALYVYFCCDCLYRLQRDGYVIPAKMLINNLEILCILAILHALVVKRKSFFDAFSSQAKVLPT